MCYFQFTYARAEKKSPKPHKSDKHQMPLPLRPMLATKPLQALSPEQRSVQNVPAGVVGDRPIGPVSAHPDRVCKASIPCQP
jgi:hypothetical protein